MKTFDELKNELLKNKQTAKEYAKLTPRYQVISELVSARINRGMTQKELAQRIGTKQSAIARLESGNVNPSFDLLEKIATEMGYKLRVQFL